MLLVARRSATTKERPLAAASWSTVAAKLMLRTTSSGMGREESRGQQAGSCGAASSGIEVRSGCGDTECDAPVEFIGRIISIKPPIPSSGTTMVHRGVCLPAPAPSSPDAYSINQATRCFTHSSFTTSSSIQSIEVDAAARCCGPPIMMMRV